MALHIAVSDGDHHFHDDFRVQTSSQIGDKGFGETRKLGKTLRTRSVSIANRHSNDKTVERFNKVFKLALVN